MSTNMSKQKREELITKIKSIRSFIAKADQDENTGNLLAYLSELEKEVKGKKYGLVFEKHRESIDDVLETHTPVLEEQKNLFIDNGGQMNFLIEGDNLEQQFFDTITSLSARQRERNLEQLLRKARQGELSSEEKNQLRDLLSRNNPASNPTSTGA